MLRARAASLRSTALERLGPIEGEAFLARLAQIGSDLCEALQEVYGEDAAPLIERALDDALAAAASRSLDLRVLDRRREVDPRWFHSEQMVGYVAYADRFAGDLPGVSRRLDYLDELGVRYLHLLPLLKPREGENDGGYAVEDYDAVDPRLGTMADLESLAVDLHERDMALCVDLVLNHTAREHEWARKALAGDPMYRDFYRFFPDRTEPDIYEATLSDVFPDMAPGSFTFLPETGEWVWATFHEFQWDLNWENPEVFRAMLGVLYSLGNHGIDALRLDAVPFLWKRKGTNCLNQPEAHRILQGLRALTHLAMPGVVLKAEAIVGPDDLVPYLGAHEVFRPECDLAYDNQLMVMLWSTLASRDARLPIQALTRRPPLPDSAGWVSYVRCHDDIGWAVSDEDASAVGLDAAAHRAFLASFYDGSFPGSFAQGADFQANPATGDVRTSGTAASLAGVGSALSSGTELEVTYAVDRLLLIHSVLYSFGGIPLVYMGDEIAMLNDEGWASDPAHEDDNRWMHRPEMDWKAARRRTEPESVEGRVFSGLVELARARASSESLRSDAALSVLPTENPHVLAYVRRHPRALPVLALACFSDTEQYIDLEILRRADISWPRHLHSSSESVDIRGNSLVLPPWGFLWLTR